MVLFGFESVLFVKKLMSLTQTMYAHFVSPFGFNKYSRELILNNNDPVMIFPMDIVRRD